MFRNLISILIVLSFFLLGCKEKQKDSEKKIFSYNEASGISSLDPAFAKDQAHIWVINQLYNGLVQMDDSLQIKPCIAKDWDILDSGCTYKFYLRNDVYFHDDFLFKDGKGRKVIAQDFAFSFSRILDPSVVSPGAWIFNSVKNLSENRYAFEVPNDSTFIVKLQKSFPPFLGLLTMQYCSVVPMEIVGHYGKDFRSHPVGTGPFKFKAWKEGVKLVLVKNENYFEAENGNKLPFIDGVLVSFISDKQSAFMEFIKGKLHFISGIDASYKDDLLTKAGKLQTKYAQKFQLKTQPYLNTEYLGILVDPDLDISKDNPLINKKVRQAINYGFDREKMIAYLRNNIGTPGHSGFVPVGLPSFDAKKVVGYSYNPEKARTLLQEAGFPDGKGLAEIVLSTTNSYLDLSEYIQSQLADLGIKIRIDVNPPATHREVVAKSKITFFRASWIADYPDAENYLTLFYSKNFSPKGPNYTHFKNAEFDKLYEKAQSEINEEVRYQYYQEMDRIIVEEAPVVVLYYDEVVRLYQNNIEGLGTNAMNLLSLKAVKIQ